MPHIRPVLNTIEKINKYSNFKTFQKRKRVYRHTKKNCETPYVMPHILPALNKMEKINKYSKFETFQKRNKMYRYNGQEASCYRFRDKCI